MMLGDVSDGRGTHQPHRRRRTEKDGNPLCPNPECCYDFKRIDLRILGYLGNELDENMEKLVRLWAVRELESGNYCGGPFLS